VLDRQKVIIALEQKQDQFTGFSVDFARQLRLVERRLAAFHGLDAAGIEARLLEMDVLWSGARPTAELELAQNLRLAFAPQDEAGRPMPWQNHADARAWARTVLLDQPVIAVDGSQITPSKDFSVPVGAIQIGWFINPHTTGESGRATGATSDGASGTPSDGESDQRPPHAHGNQSYIKNAYVKDVAFEVFAPAELASTDDYAQEDEPGGNSGQGEDALSDWRVNQARFVRECEKLCELMAASASGGPNRSANKPICLFDGSFIVSFVGQMRPSRAAPYLRAVQELLACSQDYGVPLVGYVDTSYSRDFVTLLDLVTGNGESLQLGDAALFGSLISEWGDRTPAFVCARNDALTRENRAGFYADVVFTYLRTTANRPPARLEVPRWVLDAGELERVINVVRAECVVGGGYPYAIETVDALAVISQQDRMRFYALFEQFAGRLDLGLTQARKAASKLARR
jgi:hypothetical protein